MVGQWYFAATRNGHMWNWWRYRKEFYWFSPKPCPVEWYEYFFVVTLVVGFSTLMTNLEPLIGSTFTQVKTLVTGGKDDEEDEDTAEALFGIIEGMTGIEPRMDWTLEECGLASIGVPVLVGLLNNNFSKKAKALTISASDLVEAKTIGDIVEVVDVAKELAAAKGV
jgi:hypothetical protein